MTKEDALRLCQKHLMRAGDACREAARDIQRGIVEDEINKMELKVSVRIDPKVV